MLCLSCLLVLSCLGLACLGLSCLGLSFGVLALLVLSWLVLSWLVLSRFVLSCLCLVSTSFVLVLPSLVFIPSRLLSRLLSCCYSLLIVILITRWRMLSHASSWTPIGRKGTRVRSCLVFSFLSVLCLFVSFRLVFVLSFLGLSCVLVLSLPLSGHSCRAWSCLSVFGLLLCLSFCLYFCLLVFLPSLPLPLPSLPLHLPLPLQFK